MPDIDQISELKHQISIDTLVITDLRNKVERWHGLTRDIVTVLGNNTDMFHECMDSWIDLMVDTDERETLKALAQSIVDRLHEIKRSEWTDPFSRPDSRTAIPETGQDGPAPDDDELVSAVARGLDGKEHVVTFFVIRHHLGNDRCTRKYIPTYLDRPNIALVGEKAFQEAVSKFDGKEIQDL